MKTVLTIAGSDCSGGAGIQADLKTIEAHKLYGMSVITALTAQNTVGVNAVMPVDSDFISKQLEAIFEDLFPDAIKIGMLPDKEIVKVVAEMIRKYHPERIVIDPVLSSTSGTELSKAEAREYMKKNLFCLCDVVTPNIPEAEILIGKRIVSKKDMEESAIKIAEDYGCSVLLKGGHSFFEQEGICADCLYVLKPDLMDKEKIVSEKGQIYWIEGPRIDNPNTHGTGCTLSSAIACNLAMGKNLKEAVTRAKRYLEICISVGLNLGKGRGPLLHNVL
jgi:hydroxymethylpyrimidine/phosphomethylpyrimidine kinase